MKPYRAKTIKHSSNLKYINNNIKQNKTILYFIAIMIKKHHKNPIHILFTKKNSPLRKTYFYNIFTISNHYHTTTK